MKGIIDRIEEGIAVVELETGEMVDLDLGNYIAEDELSEGDSIRIEGDSIVVDREETFRRRERVESLFKSLLKKKPDKKD